MNRQISRRQLLQDLGAVGCLAAVSRESLAQTVGMQRPLEEFGYDQVKATGKLQIAQRENVSAVLLGFDEDSLMKPFREMAGLPGPGTSLGGWYEFKSDYNYHHDDAGLAPGATYGQWMSGLARLYAQTTYRGAAGDEAMKAQVARWHELLAKTISKRYFEQSRFPGYNFDKLACGLMDAHRLTANGAAFATLDRIADVALPSLPGYAVDREVQWKIGADLSWMWDETYTMPENLYLVSAMGAGVRYRKMAEAYLDDKSYFEPLSRGVNVLADKHAYSYVNALCSAMQAYLTGGSEMHLRAAKNGFAMLAQQSFATGGWGPDEVLRKPGYDDVAKSLVNTHNSFETACGSYAHMKLTRYLLRATRDGRYGDSMERVMQNTVLGALPLQADGRTFYYADYNDVGKRIYSVHRWPCCSGTLPQVVADYGINTYLREPGAVWVNLYQPSALAWHEDGKALTIEQTGGYPETGEVKLRVTASSPASFALQLRIPAWAGRGSTLAVNGRPVAIAAREGFTSVSRTWKTGDVITLNLAMSLRLEQLPANGGTAHPETVALMWGPLVLFALREPGETGALGMTSDALLGATRTGAREWMVGGTRRMVPFTDVGERSYTTYLKLV